MKRLLAIILALALCLPLCACASHSSDDLQQQYERLVQYTTEGNYQSGIDLYMVTHDLRQYKDAPAYYEFCKICSGGYQVGKLGSTYRSLCEISNIPPAAKLLREIEGRIGFLEGKWVQDNGTCYCYLAFQDGYAAMRIVGYDEADNGFVCSDEDFVFEITEYTKPDGTGYYAIGNDYGISYIPDTQQITLFDLPGGESDTFNGTYDPIK